MIIDLHVDCIIQQRLFGYRMTRRHNAMLKGQPLVWHADIPRMRDATYVGACLGIHYWPWESEAGWFECNAQIDYLDQTVAQDPTVLRVTDPSDWRTAIEENRLALGPGVEGVHMLNGRVDRIEELAARSVQYLTITHFSKNLAATPSMGRGKNETDGLTAFGKEVVAACNANDIIIDCAHVNTPGVLDIVSASTKPVFCTHTGVKGAFNHVRNITDEELDAIAENNGVVGIMFAPVFLAGTRKASSESVADHIEYAVDRIGDSHVGIGSDYDGWIPIPSDQRDCRDISIVRDILEKRGMSAESLDKIFGINALEMLSRER